MSNELSHEARIILLVLYHAGKPLTQQEMFEQYIKYRYGNALHELKDKHFIRDVKILENDILHGITSQGKRYQQELFELQQQELLQTHGLTKEDTQQ